MQIAGITIGAARYGTARHPFRASLPRRVLRTLPEPEPEVLARRAAVEAAAEADTAPASAPARCRPVRVPAPAQAARRWPAITTQDVKDFLIAYIACLLALLTFLS